MAHPIHKLIGPMLNRRDLRTGADRPPESVEKVTEALMVPGVGYRYTAVVAREWINEAKRKNGMPGTSELIGREFRSNREIRRRNMGYRTKSFVPKPSRLQRLARAITRMFRK